MENEDTALHEAVRFGDIEEVKKALDVGENPNTNGFYRWSAIHEGVALDDTDILSLLLTHGGDPNIPDNCNGSTPLHMAAKLGYINSTRTLVEHGASVCVKNRDDKTPLEIATGPCIEYLSKIGTEETTNTSINSSISSSTSSSYNYKHKYSYKHKSSEHLTEDKHRSSEHLNRLTVSRPTSMLSVRSVTSVRSAESVLTTRSHPERGAAAQRTSRKPVGASNRIVSKAPGIRLSVEYSEETKMLKIRAWSIQCVTMVPDITAANSTIHVRSCVFPGNKIWSKTEDIPIEKYLPPSDAESGFRSKVSTFDQPITLQKIPVDRKMCFKSVSEADLSEKNIELALCCKTPAKISSKLHYIAKLFLKCNEAVNVVTPKWFLMTSCSIEKTPRNPTPARAENIVSRGSTTSHSSATSFDSELSQGDESRDLNFRNPTFEVTPFEGGHLDPPVVRPDRTSVVSVSHVKITSPVPSDPPPINKITSSISMRNPFRKDKTKANVNQARAVTSYSRDVRLMTAEKVSETTLELGDLDLNQKMFVRENIDENSTLKSNLLEDIV